MISDHDRTIGSGSSHSFPHPFRVRGSENWRALLQTRANMLLIGPRCALDAFLAAAATEMTEPVHVVSPAGEIPVDGSGTLILYDASALNRRQQEGLLALLCDAAADRPQIISLSEMHLWQQDGLVSLPEDLYYRLNTVCIELDTAPDWPLRSWSDTGADRGGMFEDPLVE
jgi:hypothetical protein